jgi:hypothetical protein
MSLTVTPLATTPSGNLTETVTNPGVVFAISGETKTTPNRFGILQSGGFGSAYPALHVTDAGFDYTFYYGFGGKDYILRRNNNTATWTVVLYANNGGIGNSSFGSSNSSSFNFGGNVDCNIPWSYLTQPDSYYSGKTFADANLSTAGLIQIPLQNNNVSISISNLNQIYNGNALPVTVSTNPSGYSPVIKYNGSSSVPVNAGTYTVTASVHESNHVGSANAIYYISTAAATIALSGTTSVTYDGSAHALTASTTPTGLSTRITYSGSTQPPSASGTYSVIAEITDNNYSGTTTGSLTITGQSYYYNNALGDGSLLTIGNWWLDSAHTIPAGSFPTSTDIVYIDGHIEIGGSDDGVGGFLATIGTIRYDTIIVGKYSTNTVFPKNWITSAGPEGWAGFLTNTMEFWNGASIDPMFADTPGRAYNVDVFVHYPCPCPLAGLNTTKVISYLGYPSGIINATPVVPIQTLWIDQSAHGTATWGAIPQNSSVSMGKIKTGDDLLFQVGFHAGDSFLNPKITTISVKFAAPQTGEIVLESYDFISCIEISSNFYSYLFWIPIQSDALTELLGSYKAGIVSSVTLQGEISWQEVNSTGCGPATLSRKSQTFPFEVTRSLNTPENF